MVESNSKDVQLDLHIKSLSLKVTEHTPVYVVWQRGKSFSTFAMLSNFLLIEDAKIFLGAKKAKTKSRLVNESVS